MEHNSSLLNTVHYIYNFFSEGNYRERGREGRKRNFTVEKLNKYCFNQVVKLNICSDKTC